MIRLERHQLGPRVYVFGRRIHEYQVGVAAMAASGFTYLEGSTWSALAVLAGLWLVVKDWPDLFPSTRDRASWRLGIHRLPSKGASAADAR